MSLWNVYLAVVDLVTMFNTINATRTAPGTNETSTSRRLTREPMAGEEVGASCSMALLYRCSHAIVIPPQGHPSEATSLVPESSGLSISSSKPRPPQKAPRPGGAIKDQGLRTKDQER